MHAISKSLAAAALALGVSAAAAAQNTPPPNPDAKVIEEFQARVKLYAELHDKLEKTLPPLSEKASPEEIVSHQDGMQRLLERARAGARQGDIFSEPIRAYFRRQLARVLEGPDGASVRRTLLDEDTRAGRLAVNARYPETVPKSTVPPQILLVLPRVPDHLEYRFVGERLVLLDVHADIVVDFIDRALSR